MHHDAIIIGGSFAGLSAAMYIARARRSVCIVDAGQPRNRFADHSHGFFTRDGSAPGDLLDFARAQVEAYPTTHFVQAQAIDATRTSEGFAVTLANGDVLEGSILILAFGMRDVLPDVPGLEEQWGAWVLPCPYCHGYEFGGQRLGVLGVIPFSVQQAMLIAEWGPTTLYLNGIEEPDAETLHELENRDIDIERAPVEALHGTDGLAIELADGRTSSVSALYTATHLQLNSTMAQDLGCALDDMAFGLGDIIRVDEQQATTVPGVFAAGDITGGNPSIHSATAAGMMAGVAGHRSLAFR